MSIPVDPITFDIVRHRLFRVVEEAILTLKHVSGSPITNEAHDLMVSLYTPDGGLLMGGVGFLHHMSCASAACKAIIRAAGRGIGAQAALGALIQGQEDIVVLLGVFAFSAVQKNIPVKLIAIYHPKTPVALITFPDKPARTPKDLVGMTVAHSVGETGTSYLDAFLKLNGVDPSKVKRTTINAQARVPAFIQRQVDVVSVYQTNDLPILLEQQETKFVIMDMVEFGLSIPGLSLATSDQNIAKKADILKRFLRASDAGVAEAKKNAMGATAALRKNWPNPPSEHAVLEQVTATLGAIPVPADHEIGWIDEKTVADTLQLLHSVGEIDRIKPSSAYFTDALLTK